MTIFIFLVTILQNPGHTPHFKLFHSPAFAPPAELNQASKMLCWEIPSPLEENPKHTYTSEATFSVTQVPSEQSHIKFIEFKKCSIDLIKAQRSFLSRLSERGEDKLSAFSLSQII